MNILKKIKFKYLHSITFTLTLAFLTLVTAMLCISGSLQLYHKILAQKNIIASRQKLIGQAAAVNVKDFIEDKLDVMQITAKMRCFIDKNEQKANLLTDKLLGSNSAFRKVYLYNQNYQPIAETSRLSSLSENNFNIKKNTACLNSIKEKQPYISPVYIDQTTNEPMITMAVPVLDAIGDLKGALAAEINLKFMWNLIADIKVGKHGSAYVVNKNGELIAANDISRVLKGESIRNLAIVAQFISNTKHPEICVHIAKGINEKRVITNYVPLDMPDWAVVTELPLNEAYAPIILEIKLMVLFISISIAFAVTASIYLSKRITKPIKTLCYAATEIGRANYNVKIKTNCQNEIGQLTRSFAEMTENLNRTTVSRDALAEEVAHRAIIEEKLKESNEKMKNFVYIASHDLREPLRKVSAFGSILKKSIEDKINSDDLENLSFMIDGAKRMNEMIEGLLKFSRVDTQGADFSNVDLNETIKALQNLELSVLIDEKKAKIEIPQPLPTVNGDKTQIAQLMQNLIANGIKYQPENAVPVITITSKPDADNFVKIEVADNGIGIKPEYQQAVFEMFKRLHSRSQYEGTGIGLAVCKKIVERHGGKIAIESQEKQGAIFWFTLPLAVSTNTKDENAEPISNNAS